MLIGKWFPYLFLDPQALSSHFAGVSHWMKEQLDGHLAADLDQLTKVTPTGLSITYWNRSGCWRSDYQLHALSIESLLYILMNFLKDSELVFSSGTFGAVRYFWKLYQSHKLPWDFEQKINYMKICCKIWPSCIKECYVVETTADFKRIEIIKILCFLPKPKNSCFQLTKKLKTVKTIQLVVDYDAIHHCLPYFWGMSVIFICLGF